MKPFTRKFILQLYVSYLSNKNILDKQFTGKRFFFGNLAEILRGLLVLKNDAPLTNDINQLIWYPTFPLASAQL